MPPLQSSPQFSDGNDEIDLTDIGQTLVRQWRKIALITLLTTCIAAWILLLSQPQFTVSGSVYLGDSQSNGYSGAADTAETLNFVSDFLTVSDVETKLQLIQARALVERAILETGMNASVLPEHRPGILFWQWHLRYHGAIDAFDAQPGDVQVLDATIANPGQRGASFKLVFDEGGRYHLVSGAGWFSTPKTILSGTLDQPASGAGVALLIKSAVDGIIPQAGSTYSLSIAPAKAVATALLEGPLTVAAAGKGSTPTQLADIQLNCANPYQGQNFVNQLMNDFIATQLSWKTQSASATENFVSDQLKKITQSLDEADKNLAAYQSKTGILDVPGNAQAVIAKLSQYDVQRTTLQLQQQALQQLQAATQHPADGLNPYLVGQTNDPLLSQLAGTLADAEIALQAQQMKSNNGDPQIAVAQATIAKIESSIANVIQNDEGLAARGLQSVNDLITQYEAQLKTMPAEALQVIGLSRSSDVYGQLYVLLMQKEEEAEVSKAATIIDTRIVSPAEIPLQASKPLAFITILEGVLLGLFGGIGLVLAQRAISGRYHTDEEVRRSIALPVYALIPRRSRSESESSIFSLNAQSPFIEGFRLLRSNLYQSSSLDRLKLILITSPSNGDGKTTISSNLAKVLSDDGHKVVLVDADLHRGRVHEALKIAQAPGLTEWLINKGRPQLQPVPGQQFVALAAGVFPPNPSELLNESSLGNIFAALRSEFDFIIVDCPPLPAVADTMSLGRHADLIFSVVFIEKTRKRAVAVHTETIGTLDRRHGMIINAVVGSAYGYGYGYSYGYGSGSPVSKMERLRRFFNRILNS